MYSIRLSTEIATLCAVSQPECSVVTRLRGGRSEVRIRQAQNVQNGSGFQPAFYSVSPGALFPGIKRQEREPGISPPSGSGLEMRGSIPPLPICLNGVHRGKFTLSSRRSNIGFFLLWPPWATRTVTVLINRFVVEAYQCKVASL